MRRRFRLFGLSLLGMAALLALVLLGAGVSLRAKRHETGVLTQVTTRVLRVRNFVSDLYAARVGDKVILFDAGMDPEGHAVLLLVRALGAELADVRDVFLTHGDFDHVAAVPSCPSARVHIGALDAEVLAQRAPPAALVPWLFGMLLGVPAAEAHDRLTERVELDVGGGEKVLALPFPGHTPGSFLYLFDGVLFAGDAMLSRAGTLTLSNANYGEDAQVECRSAAQLVELFQAERVRMICTGHTGCTPEHEARALRAQLTGLARACAP